jgi:hypothetical protein
MFYKVAMLFLAESLTLMPSAFAGEQRFDSSVWKKDPLLRTTMVSKLPKVLRHKSKTQVHELLGPPDPLWPPTNGDAELYGLEDFVITHGNGKNDHSLVPAVQISYLHNRVISVKQVVGHTTGTLPEGCPIPDNE